MSFRNTKSFSAPNSKLTRFLFQLFEFDSHMLSDSSRHEISGIIRISTPRSRSEVSNDDLRGDLFDYRDL